MRSLLRLIRLWRQVRLLTREASWDENDAAELRRFLASDTGRKLGLILRNLVTRGALSAVQARPHLLSWQCGRATGFQECAGTLDQLASWPSVAQPNPQDDRPTDDLTWLNGEPAIDTGRTG